MTKGVHGPHAKEGERQQNVVQVMTSALAGTALVESSVAILVCTLPSMIRAFIQKMESAACQTERVSHKIANRVFVNQAASLIRITNRDQSGHVVTNIVNAKVFIVKLVCA
jgi:hypothetical protein